MSVVIIDELKNFIKKAEKFQEIGIDNIYFSNACCSFNCLKLLDKATNIDLLIISEEHKNNKNYEDLIKDAAMKDIPVIYADEI